MTRLLVLNFFPAFAPPTSGGEQRYFHLYRHLSRHFDVTLLSPTYRDRAYEVVEHSGTFREHRVPKDPLHDQLHLALADAGVGAECSAVVVALAAAAETAYGRMVELLVPAADVVIHECPFTFPYDRTSGSDGKPRVYNSYNVEATLMAQMLGGTQSRRLVDFVAAMEGALLERADLVFATSAEEREEFGARYGTPLHKIRLAPNGFEPAPEQSVATEATSHPASVTGALFMGSAHPPNVEAAGFIVAQLAPAMPGTRFEILGSVCRQLGAAPANVTLRGLVSEAEKHALLRSGAIALNPMLGGAGTNLKMLDYMAAGAAIVTSPVGARGLDLRHGEHALVVAPEDFGGAVRELQSDAALRTHLGRNAAALAVQRYSWAAIGNAVAAELRRLAPPGEARAAAPRDRGLPLALVLNDFAVARPRAGGEIRINRLWCGLANRFDVVLLCLGDGLELRTTEIAPGFVEIAVPKTPAHTSDELRRGAGHMASANDVVASLHCSANAAFVEHFTHLAARAALVVFEHPYLAPMLDHLPRPVPVVYSSLNVEAALKRALLSERADFEELLGRVEQLESRLLREADLLVCVSREDCATFAPTRAGRASVVIRNGVDCAQYAPFAGGRVVRDAVGGRPVVLFLGSAHTPNIEAARFVVATLAPALPELAFLILGSCCYALAGTAMPPNVLLLGTIADEEKNSILANADIALNPMFSGGGSSLKMAEYLAAGLPVVTTRVGMRGFEVQPGTEVLLAEPADFPAAMHALLANPSRRQAMGARGAHHARSRLDWTRLSASLGDALARLLPVGSAASARKTRLLVVTYRYTQSPRGGAETFLQAVLKELHALGTHEIDLVCPAVDGIRDHWHFGARYEPLLEPETGPQFLANLRRFPLDPVDEAAMFSASRRLFEVWLDEDIVQARRLRTHLREPALMGGWYLPEHGTHGVRRWTGRHAEIHVPREAAARITLSGTSPGARRLEVLVDGISHKGFQLGGRFEVSVELDAGRDSLVRLALDRVTCVDTDPRSLGVCVESIRLGDRAGTDRSLDLAIDFGQLLRRENPARWVASLVDAAQSRAPQDDALFLRGRGPHSAGLSAWLARHAGEYDVVLGHGVPFASSVLAMDQAAAAAVPCVLLPHFHMDDKYYHWQAYYQAFRRAQRVIAAPSTSRPHFFDPLGARAVVLPGGGADPAEFPADAAHIQRFRELHGSTRPFVLALGRKSGAKQWQRIAAAVQRVNRETHRMDLVMIGPDDDRVGVSSPYVCYYGAQPRELVLGALACCTCLASMSESESFGIVLVEAWLSSRPVVAARTTPAFEELVEDGVDGFLVDGEAALAAALERYLGDPALADAHGGRGREKALAQYTWTAVARGVERCLADVVAEAAARTPAEDTRDV